MFNPRKLCGLMLLVLVARLAVGQAGQLDSTFAQHGIFHDNFNGLTGSAGAVALQSDGKMVIGGQIGGTNNTASRGVVLRLDTNGALDSSFGSAGIVTIRFGAINDVLDGLAIQTDGKILVTGTGLGGGTGDLVRLNPNGSDDTSFGNSGFVALFPFTPSGLVLQADGKIVVMGVVSGSGISELQRFNSNGQLDTTFGNGGRVALAFGGTAIGLQPDGKFLIASTSFSGSSSLVRYISNGSLDTSFGLLGQVATLTGQNFALQANGDIVSVGTVTTKASLSGNSSGFGLAGLLPNGSPNASFGTRGGVATSFPNSQAATANAAVIQLNGDIIAGGTAGNSTVASFALARYLGTGQLDNTFGTAGLVTTSFGATVASINALAIEINGKIVAVGGDSTGNLVVARYLGQ